MEWVLHHISQYDVFKIPLLFITSPKIRVKTKEMKRDTSKCCYLLNNVYKNNSYGFLLSSLSH